jgi:hypothetical protein
MMFDIDGLTVNAEGRVTYSMGMELKDKNNKVVFSQAPQEQTVTASLGGNRLAASTQITVGTDQAPGTYTVTVTVTDVPSKKSETLTRTFDVIPVELGIVRILIAYDAKDFIPAPPIGVPGQVWVVNFAPVGFTLDPKTKEAKLGVEMIIQDEAGKPVLGKPFTGAVKDVPEAFRKIYPMQFVLSLNRPGKYKMILKVNDFLAKPNKSVEETLEFKVLEAK